MGLRIFGFWISWVTREENSRKFWKKDRSPFFFHESFMSPPGRELKEIVEKFWGDLRKVVHSIRPQWRSIFSSSRTAWRKLTDLEQKRSEMRNSDLGIAQSFSSPISSFLIRLLTGTKKVQEKLKLQFFPRISKKDPRTFGHSELLGFFPRRSKKILEKSRLQNSFSWIRKENPRRSKEILENPRKSKKIQETS